ncbi:MAG: hypothetical protein ACOX00_00905 [Peptoniphilaceae bacterium]|jgi:Ca-activated chloride channel family protein
MRKRRTRILLLCVLLLLVGCELLPGQADTKETSQPGSTFGRGQTTLRIVSGSENRELEALIEDFAEKNRTKIEMTYMGSIDIMRKL